MIQTYKTAALPSSRSVGVAELVPESAVWQFARAAAAILHRLGALTMQMYCCTGLGASSLTLWAGLVPSEALSLVCKWPSFLCVLTGLPSAYVHISSSPRDASHVVRGPTNHIGIVTPFYT